jgi:hypothetical protein
MLDRACWTLTVAAVLQDKDDDRIYFADPDKLDTITIDLSSKRTGSPAYIRDFNNLQYNQGNDYRFAYRVKLRPSELYSHLFGETETPNVIAKTHNRVASPTTFRERKAPATEHYVLLTCSSR